MVPYIYPLFSLTEAQGLWVWVGDGRGRGYGEGGRLEGRLLETKSKGFIFPGFTGALAVLYSQQTNCEGRNAHAGEMRDGNAGMTV